MDSVLMAEPELEASSQADEANLGDGGAVFSGLLGAFQEQGYEFGYQRGVADVLGSLLLLAEEYLRQQPVQDAAVRRALYGFEAYVERHLDGRANRAATYVSGGLGI